VLKAFGLADEAAKDELLSALAAEDEEEKEPL
jgi:hypothetical protein